MKRIALFSLAALVSGCGNSGYSACSVGTCNVNHVVAENVVTAIAVPIGIPVSPYSDYQYSRNQYAQPQATFNEDSLAEKIGASVADHLAAKLSGGALGLKAPPTFVGNNCATCHNPNGKPAAFAKLDLSDLSRLTDGQRIKAARAVLSERMPPGKKLGPELAGKVLDELTAPPIPNPNNPNPTASVPRPAPPPPTPDDPPDPTVPKPPPPMATPTDPH